MSFDIRKLTADVGNRLIGILRAWEKDLYKFLEHDMDGIVNYMEQIEANILNHQVAIESQILSPILEKLVSIGVETHMNRLLLEILLLKFDDAKFSQEKLRLATNEYNVQRDQQIVLELRKLLEVAYATLPKQTIRPVLAKPPQQPAKPVAPAPAAAVGPAATSKT